jgi:ribosomal protein S18 acetylase RimI-like enzyme
VTVVRAASADDATAIIAVRLASWRATYADHLPPHVWDEFDQAGRAQRLAESITAGLTRVLVACQDDTIVGYTFSGPTRDDDLPDETGEIYAIYVHPSAWSTGAGRALMTATLADLGQVPVVLWVLEVNDRARRFYERAGFVPDGAVKPADMPGGVTLPELRYRHD